MPITDLNFTRHFVAGRRVDAKSISHAFHADSFLFNDLSFCLLPDHVYALTGPSGSGKSTLLSIIAGWLTPTEGEVTKTGIETIRWVFQNPHGVAHRPALDHVVLPLIAQGFTRQAAEKTALSLMDQFGISQIAHNEFSALSGGESQRLMLARGLASTPDLFLVDEPTAQLDRHTADEVNNALSALAGQGAIVVIATHDPVTTSMCTDNIDLTAIPVPSPHDTYPVPHVTPSTVPIPFKSQVRRIR